MMNVMKFLSFILVLFPVFIFSQSKILKESTPIINKKSIKQKPALKTNSDLIILNENVPLLIPKKKHDKFGYIDQKGKYVIQPEYDIAMFFAEDCNLLNSANPKVKKFGSSRFATVERNGIDYRINTLGKIIYQYKNSDLGKCTDKFVKPLFHAYILNGYYGVIEDAVFESTGYRQYKIYPQYQYLYVLEGNDPLNPMIVATHKDKFGVIDINNKIIIPFEYADIKRNYSWKLGRMFEVTKDNQNYFYIDSNNQAY